MAPSKSIISAGAVIFRRSSRSELEFLLLYHGRGYWNFPKGRLEAGEGATSAFLREVEEETGLRPSDLRIVSGFRATDRYFLSDPDPHRSPVRERGRPILKIVIYYLVEARKREIAISEEHIGFAWLSYREALRIAKYKNTKNILKRAYECIQQDLRGNTEDSGGTRRHLRRRREGHRPAAGVATRRHHPGT